jgi:DNA-binding response OmpR family regulator
MGSKCVLVVDDDLTILNLVKTTLRHAGYEVVVAHDGQLALDQFREIHPDLAIVDIAMPVMDGYEVIQEMRKIEAGGAHIPIMILSAHDQALMRDYAAELGVDAYLTKPMTSTQLVNHVERLLNAPR